MNDIEREVKYGVDEIIRVSKLERRKIEKINKQHGVKESKEKNSIIYNLALLIISALVLTLIAKGLKVDAVRALDFFIKYLGTKR